MTILTKADWTKANDFSVLVEGRKFPIQVDEEIFWEFLEVLPPEESGKDRHFDSFYAKIDFYFLVGEPQSMVDGKFVYATFAKCANKYFFLGYNPTLK